MGTIAENTTEITRALFDEAMAVVGTYRSFAWKCVGFLAAVWALLLLFTMNMGLGLSFAVRELIVLVPVGIWILVFLPKSRNKRAYASMLRKYNGNPRRTVLFGNDCCVVEADGMSLRIPYGEIAQVRQTRHLLVVTCYDNTGFFLSLDGFTKGSLETVQRKLGKTA